MTDLIATDVQGQEIDSAFITLFELDLPNGGKAFFHPGLDSNLENVHFRDATTPSQINEYIALPMDIDGLELQSDGALNRPTFSVANVTSVFEDQLGFTIHDIIGQRLTRRTTLQKYLDDGTGNSATPPVEFGKITYVIDRLAGENPTVVSFEVAVIYDLQGIELPRRKSRGKYCQWIYKGHTLYKNGGCTWREDSKFYHADSASATSTSNFFFDVEDRQLAKSSYVSVNSSAWANGASYTTSSYVSNCSKFWVSLYTQTGDTEKEPGTTGGKEYWKEIRTYNQHASGTNYVVDDLVRKSVSSGVVTLDTVWRCIRDHNSNTAGTTPALASVYWVQEDACGKKLSSCKCRFQALPRNEDSSNQEVKGEKDTRQPLPFGAFIGLNQY